MKLNCIIDTCSCINLSNAEFGSKTVLQYFNQQANLNFSNEVHKELRDHKKKGLPSFIHAKNKKLGVKKFSMNEYERRMFGKVIPSRKKNGNKGEVDNFLVSVDQIHRFKKNTVIFLTDDENAMRGILNNWIDSFPVIRAWTSYEVILYLYAEKVIPSKDIAEEVIQQIIAFTSPKPSKRSEETAEKVKATEKQIKLRKNYHDRIELIQKLLN